MITLGMVELVFACSLMFLSFSEVRAEYRPTGLSDRPSWASLTSANSGLLSDRILVVRHAVAMFAFTQTPLGRMINAVRDQS
jgi:branched-chain amino acid transport system permease protein